MENGPFRVPSLRQELLPKPLVTRRGYPQKNPTSRRRHRPFPLEAQSNFQSRRRPLSSYTNSSPGPGTALTHVLLKGVGGEQRHPVRARARFSEIQLRPGSCSLLGDPPRLPRRLDSDRLAHTSATAPARFLPDRPAPSPRSAPALRPQLPSRSEIPKTSNIFPEHLWPPSFRKKWQPLTHIPAKVRRPPQPPFHR